ncbi:MAG: hypothetical protein ACOX63_06930 [Christensenellales bacterium]
MIVAGRKSQDDGGIEEIMMKKVIHAAGKDKLALGNNRRWGAG